MVFAAVTTPRKGNQIWLVCNPALTKELHHCSLIPRLRSGSLVPKLSPFLVGRAWERGYRHCRFYCKCWGACVASFPDYLGMRLEPVWVLIEPHIGVMNKQSSQLPYMALAQPDSLAGRWPQICVEQDFTFNPLSLRYHKTQNMIVIARFQMSSKRPTFGGQTRLSTCIGLPLVRTQCSTY